ncbi:MAG: metal-dependent transcriptional regulator [Oscillibacter sp.]|nr:metal-dependent transcriptional regulator [Oscillibacter sp.]
MELTNTHLRYLLAIYDLAQSGGVVSSAQIAAALGVSKPSVARMLSILAERELVEKASYGKVALTEQGTAAARQYGERLRQLADRLPALGLDLSREEIDAAAGALAAALPERCFGAG